MRQARVLVNGTFAGVLEELDREHYRFCYQLGYHDAPVSLSMPVRSEPYEFDRFPPFFDGLLPEGEMLVALLRNYKIDRHDLLSQLLQVGHDVVGAVTIEAMP